MHKHMCTCTFMYIFISIVTEESCHIYDGFIFPPENYLINIQQYTKSTGIHTKNSWIYAMNVFLHQVKILETEEDKFDIYTVCENVFEIYDQIKQKKFISSKGKDESLDEITLKIGVQMVCCLTFCRRFV